MGKDTKYLRYGLIFFVVMFFVSILTRLLPDILWFDALGFLDVFYKRIFAQWSLWFVGFFSSFLFVFININIAKKYFEKSKVNTGENKFTQLLNELFGTNAFSAEKMINITPQYSKLIGLAVMGIAILFSLGGGGLFAANWLKVYAFLKQTMFGLADPLFNKDVGFYIFSLPLLKAFYGQFGFLLFVSALGSLFFYALSGEISFWKKVTGSPKVHLSLLGFLFSIWILIGLKISAYGLLFSSQGIVFGAGFADIYGQLVSIKVLTIAMILLAILFLVNIKLTGLRLPILGVALVISLSIVMGGIYPAVVQKFVVAPNELTKEEPYIKHNIKYTQLAYGLTDIVKTKLNYQKNISRRELLANQDVVNNIRLWDPTPLRQTYKQIQEIRLYYDFNDIDVDRYILNGKPTQLMLAARELDSRQIPDRARNWINEKLKYTHGYGIVANQVNEVTPEGLPNLIVKDIPPVSDVLNITKPEIYYGEKTNEYVVVNTKTEEFDYPQGDENKYTAYNGLGGVILDNLFKRFIYALKFSDFKLFISGYITKKSKILYERNIMARIYKIAPFLNYDSDPYVIVDDQGKVFWIVDGYTYAKTFPYSQPYNRRINYMRNSVKVVVDAYNGSVVFYKLSGDPIIETYDKIFPTLFKKYEDMPEGIKAHIRYPEELFYVQAQMYASYHMENPSVFYNQEDLWELPLQKYENNTIVMSPYYFYGKLPGEKKLSYMLAMPFTPAKKNNLISILTVKCDPESLGEMKLIQLPKKELIYGPMQVETRIDQDADISKELSLWSQKGSSVIRGNMLLIPIANSILYVEPIYLKATTSQMPELKRIVVAQGDKIAMRRNFSGALSTVLNMSSIKNFERTVKKSLKEMAQSARDLYLSAEDALKNSNWEQYGKKVNELKSVLNEMVQ